MDAMTLLAAKQFPDILRAVGSGDVAEADVAKALSTATGKTDPQDVAAAIAASPDVANAVAAGLAQLVLDAHKSTATGVAEDAEADANTANARDLMLRLITANSPISNVPAILSYCVVIGFLSLVTVLVSGWMPKLVDTAVVQLVNICFGTLTTGFATVLNFWLGSSAGSRHKDTALTSAAQMQQISDAGKKPAKS